MYRPLSTLALGVVLMLTLAAPAAGAQTKTPVSGADTLTHVLDEGRTWVSGGIQHVRGWTGEYSTTGVPSAYLDGTTLIVANWNLDLASGDGTMWGTADLTVAGGAGGWRETWVAKFDAGVWSGWGIGRGYGTLRGMKLRIDVWSTGFGTSEFEGFVR